MLPAVLAVALATAAGPYEAWQVESETTCVGDPDHAFARGMAAILTLRNGKAEWLPLAAKAVSAKAPVRVLWR
jgi:hypothetical protein